MSDRSDFDAWRHDHLAANDSSLSAVTYATSPPLDDLALNTLFRRSWPGHVDHSFGPVLARSASVIAAFDGPRLIGFINLVTDGGAHAFLLDPTVDPDYRRRRIGLTLIEHAVNAARSLGCEWVHVDYEPELVGFYSAAGFRATQAALLHLDRTG